MSDAATSRRRPTTALRLHRRHRRAQRRQVDAGQRAGRRQGVDRLHKVQTTRVPVRGIAIEGDEPARLHRHARHLRAAAAARPRHGGGRLGRRGRRRHRRAGGRCGQGHRRGRRAHPRQARRTSQPPRDPGRSTRSTASRRSSCSSWRAELNAARCRSTRTFMISALERRRRRRPQAHLAARVPPGPWHYPEDEISDAPLRLLAAEITREKIYDRLHDELPYAGDRRDDGVDRSSKDGSVRIEQTIYVERDSQKAHRARQGRPDHQADLDGGAPGAGRRSWSARCTCSCSSRCARTGATIPSATARWASSSPRIDVSSRKLRCSYPGPSRRQRPTKSSFFLRLRNLSNLARKRFR